MPENGLMALRGPPGMHKETQETWPLAMVGNPESSSGCNEDGCREPANQLPFPSGRDYCGEEDRMRWKGRTRETDYVSLPKFRVFSQKG